MNILFTNEGDHYIINYSNKIWLNLIEQIKSFKAWNYININEMNKSRLISNIFILADLNELSYDLPLSLLIYLGEENQSLTWLISTDKLLKINKYIKGNFLIKKWRLFIKTIANGIIQSIGFENSAIILLISLLYHLFFVIYSLSFLWPFFLKEYSDRNLLN